MLQLSIAKGHTDPAVELLASPAAHFDAAVLEQQCLSCADDNAAKYENWWQGQKTVLEALLQHLAAQQFGVTTLQRLVSVFAHPGLHQYGTDFHPLELVLKLPVAQCLDDAALLALVTTCIEANVPAHGFAAALTAPAAAQWSFAQLRGLLQAAARARNVKAVDQLLRHPAAPAATNPDVQLCRVLFAAEDYTFWLAVQNEEDHYSVVRLKRVKDEDDRLDGPAGDGGLEHAEDEEVVHSQGSDLNELLDDDDDELY